MGFALVCPHVFGRLARVALCCCCCFVLSTTLSAAFVENFVEFYSVILSKAQSLPRSQTSIPFSSDLDGQPGSRAGKWIRIEGGNVINEDTVRTARETLSHSAGLPAWTNSPTFEYDVFTFARVIFQNDPYAHSGRGFGPRLGWWVDYPDADLNLSWRLQQLTSIRTDPDGRVVKLTDRNLFNYPLLYMEHAGYMQLTEEEVATLQNYLRSGGALFVNDFWGSLEWDGFASQMQQVLPGSSWRDLDTDHPLFSCIFDLRGPIYRLRVPTMQFWNEEFEPNDPDSSPHRVFRGDGSDEMTVRAIVDKAGRIVVLTVHNSDVSDGWEREAENDRYFRKYSEPIAYPLAINIIFYLMTH